MPTDAQRRQQASAHHAEVQALTERIALLEQQLAEARKDSDRYQFLRSRVPGGTYRIMGVVYSEGGSGVDAAIDAAIASTQEKP